MAKLKIGRMVIGVYATNCYFLYREGYPNVLVADPADQGELIYKKLKEKGFTVEGILLTHGHFDHIWGANELRAVSKAPIYALDTQEKLCENANLNVSTQAGRTCSVIPDHYVKDGEELTVADMSFKVLATPGHTSDSCCFYFEEAGFLICGDTLFLESIGRTDFPTGSSSSLLHSVREKIFVLPDTVTLYPGHGESSTVEHEKKYNPFF